MNTRTIAGVVVALAVAAATAFAQGGWGRQVRARRGGIPPRFADFSDFDSDFQFCRMMYTRFAPISVAWDGELITRTPKSTSRFASRS